MDTVEPLQEDWALLVHVFHVLAVTAAVGKFMTKIQPLRFYKHLETLQRLQKHGPKSGNNSICFLMALLLLRLAEKKRQKNKNWESKLHLHFISEKLREPNDPLLGETRQWDYESLHYIGGEDGIKCVERMFVRSMLYIRALGWVQDSIYDYNSNSSVQIYTIWMRLSIEERVRLRI